MGQHTWFVKSKIDYLRTDEIYHKLGLYEDGEIYLSDEEVKALEREFDTLEEDNSADYYHDLFRTSKRNMDRTYSDDIITSKAECFEFIENPKNLVSFRNTIFDTDEEILKNKSYVYEKLNEFWDKYPNGLIYFG